MEAARPNDQNADGRILTGPLPAVLGPCPRNTGETADGAFSSTGGRLTGTRLMWTVASVLGHIRLVPVGQHAGGGRRAHDLRARRPGRNGALSEAVTDQAP